ncbi:MAG: AAA family ATPase [Candidatus Omnitrophica bacterium]|nr:AAA family ATPase [Candidatus Omnitrophota bacterium]
MYEEYFGLKEAPFNVTPDPKFIFFSPKHLDAFSCLLYGIESRRGFIQITGEIGAGKTTLCRAVLDKLKDTQTHTALILNPRLSELHLLRTIAEDFGIFLKARNKKECFDGLNRFLLEQFHKGFNTVLIIDEAQDLTPKTLEQVRLLSNLETYREKLIQIVLVGQPELRETLDDPTLAQLRQRIAIRFHLTALDRHETEEYILHRLRVAGLPEGLSPFLVEAVDYVYERSQGVPRLINKLCDISLLAAYARNLRQVDEKLAEEAFCESEGITVG